MTTAVRRRSRLLLLFALLGMTLGGCDCEPPVRSLTPGFVVVTPRQLTLPPVYVGQVARGVVTATNLGETMDLSQVSVIGPFSAIPGRLGVAGGASEEIIVSFAPAFPGSAVGVLRVGTIEVPVEAEGLEVPECRSTNVCVESRFEVMGARCVEAQRPDGTACETNCVTGGCAAGTCVGRLKGCDDSNACTVDACDETTGCSHQPRICPQPAAPCQVARCDEATGCATEPAVDGTLCGPDNCLATQVDVCIAGACVTRPRPDSGRCANRWVVTSIPGRSSHAMAYDAARQRIVLFGGSGGTNNGADTWEWNGSSWSQKTPVASPPARHSHSMAYDAARQRVVLFGGQAGNNALADTWEWDGVTWTQRSPASSPPARLGHAMAFGTARQRVVLFGGQPFAGMPYSDTWEWDGRTWTQRTPTTAPPPGPHLMASDATRQRIVLFGGSDTWEWDGTTWTQRMPATSPPLRSWASMAFDATRQRMVLVGGYSGVGTPLSETWEWDGSTWAQRSVTSPPARFRHAMAYDGTNRRLVLFGGLAGPSGPHLADTWLWDGSSWTETNRVASPPTRVFHAMAYDTARQRVVLFGGRAASTFFADTWEWDGSTWAQRSPATSPAGRIGHVMVFDAARRRVVLFGGAASLTGGRLSDTWEWDGSTWSQKSPTASPPARQDHSMAYDDARQRVVLFGGFPALSDTWEWDGSTWTQRTPATSPTQRFSHAMAYDTSRQRVVLFGGSDNAFSDTWEWDGSTWTQRTPGTSPTGRGGHAMAYDSVRQRVFLHGGTTNFSNGFSDSWEWDGTTWTRRIATNEPETLFNSMVFDSARQRMTLFISNATWVLLP